MSSGDLTFGDGDLHVYRDFSGLWWAVGPYGYGRGEASYGGGRTRREAISVARNASATGFHGKKRIIVHGGGEDRRKVVTVIREVNDRPTPQSFQEDVE